MIADKNRERRSAQREGKFVSQKSLFSEDEIRDRDLEKEISKLEKRWDKTRQNVRVQK